MKVLFSTICLFFASAWLFSCQSADNNAESNTNAVNTVNPTKVYAMYCNACHGEDGKAGVGGAKNLAESALSKQEVIQMIANGSENKKMMGYGKLLTEQELDKLADYVITLRKF